MDSKVKDVGVQWEPPDPDWYQDLGQVLGLGLSEAMSSLRGHRGHREVGVQCDRTETTESGVQVDLITQALSGPSMMLQCVSVRAEGPGEGALLQHYHKPRPRGRPRLNRDQTGSRSETQDKTRNRAETQDQIRTRPETGDQTRTRPETKDQNQGDQNRTISDTEDQTRTKTRTRTREIRPSRRYQDYETPESPERKRRRGAEEGRDTAISKSIEEDQSILKSAEEESRTRDDPNWTLRNRAAPQNFVSHDATVRVKEEAGLVSAGGVVCDVCGKVLKTKSSLSRHALVHSGKQPHSCRFCPLRFNRKDNLRHHLRIMHPNGPAPRVKLRPPPITWLCHTCGKTFTHRSRLKTHEQIHTGVKPCQCPLCPKAYMRMNDLEHHLKRLHPHGSSSPPPPSQLLCHMCGRSFSCKSLLSLHLQKHTGERPHLCHLCGRKFSRKQQLQVHRAAMHRGAELQRGEELQQGEELQREEREEGEEDEEGGDMREEGLVCDVCGRRMRSAAMLEAHRAAHSGEKPFQCSVCGKGFLRAQTLKQHQLHFHLRPQSSGACALAPARPCSFPCSVCGRSFRFPSLLSAHMTVHSDERPFTCDLCPRSFRRVSHLKRHVEGVHPDGRPRPTHICPICGTDQKFRSKLERHLLVHSGERPYSCDRCSQSFGRLGNLQQHKRRMHGDHIQRLRHRYGWDQDDDTPRVVFSDEENEPKNHQDHRAEGFNGDKSMFKQEMNMEEEGRRGEGERHVEEGVGHGEEEVGHAEQGEGHGGEGQGHGGEGQGLVEEQSSAVHPNSILVVGEQRDVVVLEKVMLGEVSTGGEGTAEGTDEGSETGEVMILGEDTFGDAGRDVVDTQSVEIAAEMTVMEATGEILEGVVQAGATGEVVILEHDYVSAEEVELSGAVHVLEEHTELTQVEVRTSE